MYAHVKCGWFFKPKPSQEKLLTQSFELFKGLPIILLTVPQGLFGSNYTMGMCYLLNVTVHFFTGNKPKAKTYSNFRYDIHCKRSHFVEQVEFSHENPPCVGFVGTAGSGESRGIKDL